jgi:hypothetical protein
MPRHRLNSAQDLAQYHVDRDRVYGLAAELLTPQALERVVEGFRPPREVSGEARADLFRALSDGRGASAVTDFEHIFVDPALAVPLKCGDHGAGARAKAYATALCSLNGKASDLRVLGRLAARTARALVSGDLAEASSLSDVQAQFLRDHAAVCIGTLASALLGSGAPFYAAVGGALDEQISEDLRLLAPHK